MIYYINLILSLLYFLNMIPIKNTLLYLYDWAINLILQNYEYSFFCVNKRAWNYSYLKISMQKLILIIYLKLYHFILLFIFPYLNYSSIYNQTKKFSFKYILHSKIYSLSELDKVSILVLYIYSILINGQVILSFYYFVLILFTLICPLTSCSSFKI